ncbi:MAG: chemotaxis protein CheC [Nanobdellota archaeon]
MMEINEMQEDAIKEVGNVGIGNAATALSQLLDKKIEIKVPETKFVPISEFSKFIGGPEKVVMSLYLNIFGDIKGECILLFPQESAKQLVDLMVGNDPGQTKVIDEMGMSAFKEMSNIFAGSYVNAIADMLSIKVFPSVPHVATDMAQSVIDFALINLAKSADEILSVHTKIEVEGHDIDGEFVMLFEDESLKQMADILNKIYGV